MNLDDYRIIFASVSLVLILIAAVPIIGLVEPLQVGEEPFSESWILSPNHIADDYPFNVRVNESYRASIGVGNHMGVSSYYLLLVKFRNQTQSLPDVNSSMPSTLPALYEYRFFVGDGEIWESTLNFSFNDVSIQGDSLFVGDVSINGMVSSVDSSSIRNLGDGGSYFELFLELWIYDETNLDFQYQNQFVGIWLYMIV